MSILYRATRSYYSNELLKTSDTLIYSFMDFFSLLIVQGKLIQSIIVTIGEHFSVFSIFLQDFVFFEKSLELSFFYLCYGRNKGNTLHRIYIAVLYISLKKFRASYLSVVFSFLKFLKKSSFEVPLSVYVLSLVWFFRHHTNTPMTSHFLLILDILENWLREDHVLLLIFIILWRMSKKSTENLKKSFLE